MEAKACLGRQGMNAEVDKREYLVPVYFLVEINGCYNGFF
jgi:hypothetical protein